MLPRRRDALVALLLAVAACVPDTASPPSPTVPAPAATARPSGATASALAPAVDAGVVSDARVAKDASAAPTRALVPDGPAHWRSMPTAQNGFYTVVDGLCSELEATRVGKDVVVHYGGGGNAIYNNGKRRGAASFIALRDDGLESIGDPSILSPTGVAGASLDDFWIADSTGSRSSEGAILHRYVGGTWKKYAKDQTNLHAWVDGGIIGSLGFAAANGDIWVEGSNTRPPESLWVTLPFPSLAAFPTGDVLLAGHSGSNPSMSGPLVARHWAPSQKVTEYSLASIFPGGEGYVRFTEVAPNEIYATVGSRIARWDGAGFRLLGSAIKGEPIGLVRRAAPDDLWFLSGAGRLARVTSAGVTTVVTPEPVADFDGVDLGAIWMVGTSGKLYRRDGQEWTQRPLPSPAFSTGGARKAKRVIVVSPDLVLLKAMYWEKGLGWKDQELHTALFSTKRVKETLRCNEPDPENNNIELGRGFQSWPPMATADCPTPFVVLARRSNATRVTDDWPRIRAALKGHAELAEVSLVEFLSGDRVFVGAKASSLDAAKSLVAVVAKQDRLRPEIVCGEPEPKRTLSIDLATGAATPR